MGLGGLKTVCNSVVTKNVKVIRHSSCYILGHWAHGRAMFLVKK